MDAAIFDVDGTICHTRSGTSLKWLRARQQAPLPYGEVYSALQTHLIDGAENNWPSFRTTRQFEVARYWSETGHSYAPDALVLSRRTFDSLAPDDRALRELLAFQSSDWAFQVYNASAGEYPRERATGHRENLKRARIHKLDPHLRNLAPDLANWAFVQP